MEWLLFFSPILQKSIPAVLSAIAVMVIVESRFMKKIQIKDFKKQYYTKVEILEKYVGKDEMDKMERSILFAIESNKKDMNERLLELKKDIISQIRMVK